MKNLRNHPTLMFSLPVIFENLFTTGAGLVFSWLIGGISGSSLTTIAQSNQVITFITAAATMLVTGSGILCARLLGGGEQREASHIAEQTLLLTLTSSVAIAMLCLAFARPLMTLLMPNAEAAVLSEGVAFFRVLILSLPALLLTNMLSSVLRSSGDARSPMAVSLTVCAVQLLSAWLFLRARPMGVIGAGLSYLTSRTAGASLALFVLLRSHRYAVQLRNLLKPDPGAFRRILHIGIPTSVESIFCQAGYLIAGSMVIGLGTFEAAAYNVANTIYTFGSLPQGICSAIAMTLVGQLIGAGETKRARRTGWTIWCIGMCVSLLINFLLASLGGRLSPIYSADAAVQHRAAQALWTTLIMSIPGISLNSLDPQLRVGGDVRYVMYTTIIGVWGIRLPLTYLFCYVGSMGAPGVFLANAISLAFRMVVNMHRFIRGKYLTMRV